MAIENIADIVRTYAAGRPEAVSMEFGDTK
jgi:hypothetical protein